ncbi:UDP-N-acetylglucosamine transferase subunit ALG14 isoform X2 [Scleropages formosus]|uniref:UDP-N-acetylglucosamine transferase subunit ALG14 isoform X2 n=1 Tax=Scleropages formosus TaxID=113540 RepID=UPI0010FA6FC7|nr:UDP-N-acetylglucosamine transferase subunit ALG14 homolog isoform X2 [Scleropages formosus]
MAVLLGVLCGLCLVIALFAVRLLAVLRSGPRCRPGAKGSVSVLAVAGSGGHTTEILRLMESLSASYSPRHYVIADTDHMSEDKICTLEAAKNTSDLQKNFTIHHIPRSREVRQAWSSSVLSTANALLYSVPLVFRLRPDMPLSGNVEASFSKNEQRNRASLSLWRRSGKRPRS